MQLLAQFLVLFPRTEILEVLRKTSLRIAEWELPNFNFLSAFPLPHVTLFFSQLLRIYIRNYLKKILHGTKNLYYELAVVVSVIFQHATASFPDGGVEMCQNVALESNETCLVIFLYNYSFMYV